MVNVSIGTRVPLRALQIVQDSGTASPLIALLQASYYPLKRASSLPDLRVVATVLLLVKISAN